MFLAAIIILGLILLGLIIILLLLFGSFNTLQRYIESIHGALIESKQTLTVLTDIIREVGDKIESIHNIADDIRFQQQNLEKDQINEAIKRLEGIELSLSDLKGLQETLSSLESSLDTIVAHPAFTTSYDDDPL